MRDNMRKICKKIAGLVCGLLAVCAMCINVSAAYEYSIALPVSVETTGDDVPEGVTYTFAIEAVDEAPLPEETTVTATGSGIVYFSDIEYTRPGDYVYTITQTAGDQEYMTYDESVYEVTVRVVNDDECGMTAVVWAIRNGEGEKLDEISFTNSYDAPVAPTPEPEAAPQTGVDNNMFGWYAALGGSLALLVILAFVRFKKEKEAE